ncbi:hypothetical protein [uncultured Eudoraea sp.]|uniref:hypothetical protein n=1 Tax=uncultured Eudoraea sp. TaxID=1035614 RepID=UPI0026349133|nr:hypothetical protein [uncultured Eudoraea sp.]
MNKIAKIVFGLGILCSLVLFPSCSKDSASTPEPIATPEPTQTPTAVDKRETFTFSSNGISIEGEIFLPSEYETNKNLPAIYLFDFPEQISGLNPNFHVATDEFDKVIGAVKNIKLNALVITMSEYKTNEMILPRDFQEYSDIFKSMTSYVDGRYSSNTSRTFIARGNEANMVLMTLFFEEPEASVFQNFIATDALHVGDMQAMLETEDVPLENENKKLHYSNTDEARNAAVINAIIELELPWLEFESVTYPNMTFENGYPTAFTDGIKFIFED